MVKLDLCPKCKRKSFYYRVAFGSWRCSKCNYEQEGKDKNQSGDHIRAEQFWRSLSTEDKISIHKLYQKAKEIDKIQREENNKLSHNSIEGETQNNQKGGKNQDGQKSNEKI